MLAFLQKRRSHAKRMSTIPLIFLLLFLPLSTKSLVVVLGESGEINYSVKSTVTYINPLAGANIWNLTEEDRSISLFMNNSWQNVELKNISSPIEALESDTDGNYIAVLKLSKQQLSPGENFAFTAEYNVVSKLRAIPDISEEDSGTLDNIPLDFKENFTRAEGPWLTKNLTLIELAHETAGNETKVLTIIKNFVGWININIDYVAQEFPLYPNETLAAREGDCDDQANLLITLSRIMGIPARLQIGTIYKPEPELVEETYWDNHVQVAQRKIGWHGWAMVYVPPWGWLPVDLTYVNVGFADPADPLNAVRYGAVLFQETIQYMNFSKTDYVAESRQAKSFILQNGFFIDLKDEMAEIKPDGLSGKPDLTTFAASLGLATVVLLVSCLLIAHRWRRHLQKPEPTVTLSR